MSEQRPFGSYDWNHNGEYDLFDKITDRYVFEKVQQYTEKRKPQEKLVKETPQRKNVQKSGTASVNREKESPGHLEEIEKDLANTENFVIEAEKISWDEVRKNSNEALTVSMTQYVKCMEYKEKIREVLEGNSSEEEKKQMCIQILGTVETMCRESEKMYVDYSVYSNLLQAAAVLVSKDQSREKEMLTFLKNMDEPYRILVGMQVKSASELKDALNSSTGWEKIFPPDELHVKLRRLARIFNSTVDAVARRLSDFYQVPTEEFIDALSHEYEIILEGLPQRDVETLDESCWMRMLDAREKECNGGEYKQRFLENRRQFREKKRQEEREAVRRKYWEEHPELIAKISELQKEIQETQDEIKKETNKIRKLTYKKRPSDLCLQEMQQKTEGLQAEIGKIEAKWWKKKKDRAELQELQEQLQAVKADLEKKQKEGAPLEKEWSEQKQKLEALERMNENRRKQIEEIEKLWEKDLCILK